MSEEDHLHDWELALLINARELENPRVVEAHKADILTQHEDLVEGLSEFDIPTVVEHETEQKIDQAEALLDEAQSIDDPEVVDAEQREEELEALSRVGDVLSEALQEHHDLREDVVEGMSVPTMVSQFEDEEDDTIDLEALAQHPETGGGGEDPEEPEGDDPEGDDEGLEDLDAETRSEIKEKLESADRMENRTPEFAEEQRAEAASMAGVESYEDIELEVL